MMVRYLLSSNFLADTLYNIDVTLNDGNPANASEKTVRVDFTVTPNTAVLTHDYELLNSSNTLTFDPGTTRQQIMLRIKADNMDEDDENFSVQLTSITNAQFASGTDSPQSITITDNDAPPVFSIENVSVTEGVDSGGMFVITQTPASGKTVSVVVTIADDTATAGANEDYVITGTGGNIRTLKFKKVDVPADSVTQNIAFTIHDDNLDEENETFTATLSNLNPGTHASLNNTKKVGTATIIDANDNIPRVSITITNHTPVEEGESIIITLKTNKPNHPLTSENPIHVALNVDQGEEFIAFRVPRVVKMTSSVENFEIHTLKNPVVKDDENRKIQISISSYDVSYTVDPNKSSIEVTIMIDSNASTELQPRISIADKVVGTILNNPNLFETSPTIANSPANQLPIISINAITNVVDEGTPAQFVISSNQILNSNLTIIYTLSLVGDFFGNLGQEVKQTTLPKYQNMTLLEIPTIDDNLAEQDGAVTISLIDADTYILSNQDQARVVISDLIDREQRAEELTHATKNIFSDLTGAIGVQTFNITTDRVQQAFSNSANSSTFTFDGNQDLTNIIASSGEALNENSLTIHEVLGTSSFSIGLFPENKGTSSATIWGIGDNLALTSEHNLSSQTWDGDVFTGHIGIDTLIGQVILTGISTSLTESEFEYSGVTEDSLLFKTRSTALNPYLGWSSTDESTKLQTFTGFGVGEIDIDQPNYELQTVSSTYFTLGVSGNTRIFYSENIFNDGVSKLTISGQSWLARQHLLGLEGLIDSLQSDASHYQIEVSGAHTQHLTNSSTLVPAFTIGLRRDRKNLQSIFGLDLGSKISFTSPTGLSLSGNSNLFLIDQSKVQEWRINGDINYDRDNDKLGTILAISSSYGNEQDFNTSTSWNHDIIGNVREWNQYPDGFSVKSELGYSINILDEISTLTPFAGIDYSEIANNNFYFGTRIEFGKGLEFELTGTQKTSPTSSTNHMLQLDGTINW